MKALPPKKIPGPGLFSLLKNTNKLRRDPLKFGEELIERYGKAIKIRIGPYQVVGLSEPSHFHWVLKENWTNYPKGKAYEKMGPLMGDGLLMAEAEFWRQNRAIVQPAFRLNRLENFFEEMKVSSNILFKEWNNTTHLNIHQEMMRFTLSVISKSLFNKDLGKDSKAISHAIHDFMAGMEEHIFYLFPFQKHLPTKMNRKFKASVKFLDKFVYDIIEDRRGKGGKEFDLVAMLINASNKEGAKGITDKYLRDEIMNFFVGGHETTANAITWCLYNLGKYSWAMEEVLKEIKNLPDDFKLTDLDKFPYLDMVINESLRMLPPIWILSRETKNSDVIDGMIIPKGSIVVCAPYFLHHRKDIWENPGEFNPLRFAPAEEAKRPKNSFLPFGLGPRACIGEMVARMEIKTFIIMFLKKYSFTIDESVPVIPMATITLRPKNGMYIHIKERKL